MVWKVHKVVLFYILHSGLFTASLYMAADLVLGKWNRLIQVQLYIQGLNR